MKTDENIWKRKNKSENGRKRMKNGQKRKKNIKTDENVLKWTKRKKKYKNVGDDV